MQIAASLGYKHMMKNLLRAGALYTTDYDDKTPLFYALVKQHVSVLKTIVTHFQEHKHDFVITQKELTVLLNTKARITPDIIQLAFA